jgi:hypothetical protein
MLAKPGQRSASIPFAGRTSYNSPCPISARSRSTIMIRTLLLLAAFAVVPTLASAAEKAEAAKTAAGPAIGHMVYFKLKDSSAASREKLVAACKKYLSEHEGTVFFAAGPIGDEFKREVNDRDWDVGLHVVFANKAAHDKYQDHPEHLKFIAENKDTWAKVRVFDSELKDVKLMGKGIDLADLGGLQDKIDSQLADLTRARAEVKLLQEKIAELEKQAKK